MGSNLDLFFYEFLEKSGSLDCIPDIRQGYFSRWKSHTAVLSLNKNTWGENWTRDVTYWAAPHPFIHFHKRTERIRNMFLLTFLQILPMHKIPMAQCFYMRLFQNYFKESNTFEIRSLIVWKSLRQNALDKYLISKNKFIKYCLEL